MLSLLDLDLNCVSCVFFLHSFFFHASFVVTSWTKCKTYVYLQFSSILLYIFQNIKWNNSNENKRRIVKKKIDHFRQLGNHKMKKTNFFLSVVEIVQPTFLRLVNICQYLSCDFVFFLCLVIFLKKENKMKNLSPEDFNWNYTKSRECWTYKDKKDKVKRYRTEQNRTESVWTEFKDE